MRELGSEQGLFERWWLLRYPEDKFALLIAECIQTWPLANVSEIPILFSACDLFSQACYPLRECAAGPIRAA